MRKSFISSLKLAPWLSTEPERLLETILRRFFFAEKGTGAAWDVQTEVIFGGLLTFLEVYEIQFCLSWSVFYES